MKVSVIIPTYKNKSTLTRAVNSVLTQTYDNYEVIVVDDNEPGSQGRIDTEKQMQLYSNNPYVKYIKHEHNKNGSAARNTGFRNSTGELICLLDDDDIFLPEKITKQVDYLIQHKGYDGCYCWRNQKGTLIKGTETGDLTKSLLDLSFTPYTSSLMIWRRCYEALNGFDESYIRHQDFEFLIRFFKKFRLGVVEDVLIMIIGNEINNVPRGEKLYKTKKQFFEQFEKDIIEIDRQEPGYLRKVYAEHFSTAFKDCIRYGNFITAIKIYFVFGIKGGTLFWKRLYNRFDSAFKERVSKIR